VALGNTLLVILYHALKNRVHYSELGPEYLDRQESERRTQQLAGQLERLGDKVALEPCPAA
jgi:hypothetical protein